MAALAGPNGWLRSAAANELQLPSGSVRFSNDVEPLVRWLETAPKEKVVAGFVEKIQSGIPYYRLLASVFLKVHSIVGTSKQRTASQPQPRDTVRTVSC